MNYSVLVFDRITEDLLNEVKIPIEYVGGLKVIMSWSSDVEAIYEYELGFKQLQDIEQLMGVDIANTNCIFQLSCSL